MTSTPQRGADTDETTPPPKRRAIGIVCAAVVGVIIVAAVGYGIGRISAQTPAPVSSPAAQATTTHDEAGAQAAAHAAWDYIHASYRTADMVREYCDTLITRRFASTYGMQRTCANPVDAHGDSPGTFIDTETVSYNETTAVIRIRYINAKQKTVEDRYTMIWEEESWRFDTDEW